MAHLVRVFIASPSDVQAERRLVIDAIQKLNPRLERLFGCTLVAVNWESFADLVARKGQQVQDAIMPYLRSSHVFVGIIHRRYGSPAYTRRGKSGTEEEFLTALKQRDRIKILSYFRRLTPVEQKRPQYRDVVGLRKRIEKQRLGCKEYGSTREFQEMILLDLLESIVTSLPDQQYRNELARFFRVGVSDNQDSPRVLICYPPIDKDAPGTGEPIAWNWRSRLVPNVVFEDVKAIQRIEACIRKIGVRAVKAVTTISPDAQSPDYNKIWLCLPRNVEAQNRLQRYDGRRRFRLEGKPGSRTIVWTGEAGREVRVASPLAKYLERQRPCEVLGTGWKYEYGNIVARDFAVMARFTDRETASQRGAPFREYFVFGIRGLGTWGAAWFIHHRADRLAEIISRQESRNRTKDGQELDVQALLQVTYHNHRIIDVVNVSAEKQDYFDDQNSQARIDIEILKRFPERPLVPPPESDRVSAALS